MRRWSSWTVTLQILWLLREMPEVVRKTVRAQGAVQRRLRTEKSHMHHLQTGNGTGQPSPSHPVFASDVHRQPTPTCTQVCDAWTTESLFWTGNFSFHVHAVVVFVVCQQHTWNLWYQVCCSLQHFTNVCVSIVHSKYYVYVMYSVTSIHHYSPLLINSTVHVH